MLTASSTDGPALHTRSHTQNTPSSTTSTPHPEKDDIIIMILLSRYIHINHLANLPTIQLTDTS